MKPLALAALLATAASSPTYRALGTEPFWALTLDGRTMRLDRPDRPPVVVPQPQPRPSFNGLRYVAPAMTVDVTRTPCSDGMSDRRYPDTVTVSFGRQTLHGCGGLPVAAQGRGHLEGVRWRIAALDGRPIRLDRPTGLRFDGGRLGGSAGCNSLGGSYRLDGDRLTASRVIATQMACPGPAMAIERRFLALLAEPALRVRWQGRDQVALVGRSGFATLVAN